MNEQKKYKMVKEDSGKLYRIQALIDIPEYFVEAGDFGGLIQSEINLSQFGDGWIESESMVTGNAIVKGGVIKGKSYLKDEVVVYSGVISDSTLSGKTIIKGRTEVSSSTLWNCNIMNGNIVSSELYNVVIKNGSGINDSIIRSSDPLEIEVTVIINKSNLRLETGIISRPGRMYRVQLETQSILIETDFTLKNIQAKISKMFWLRSSLLGRPPEKSKIIGTGEEHVFIEASSLMLRSSTVKGSVKMYGSLSLMETNVSGMSSISMKGALIDSEVSEMASIHFNQETVVKLTNLRLGGDRLYNEEVHEEQLS